MTRLFPSLKFASLLLVLMSLPMVFNTAAAQQRGDDRIKGTIEVTRGADLHALAKITLEEAREIALKAVPGAVVRDIELEEEDGYLVWDVDMRHEGREVELLIDAGDGSVLETDWDD